LRSTTAVLFKRSAGTETSEVPFKSITLSVRRLGATTTGAGALLATIGALTTGVTTGVVDF